MGGKGERAKFASTKLVPRLTCLILNLVQTYFGILTASRQRYAAQVLF